MTDLAGKVAIVTGGSRGIGAGIAFVLAKAGAAVTLVARDRRRVSQLAKEIVANGGRALALACDVADYGSVRAMVAEAERQLGDIDILVNNAGVIEPNRWAGAKRSGRLEAEHRGQSRRRLSYGACDAAADAGSGQGHGDQHLFRCRTSPA
jgi:NAD(P)-dependent dehydrogenase (short-subunit alcohol dehydrogenase family)